MSKFIAYILILFFASGSSSFSQPQVVSVFPTAQTITADKNSTIIIEFDLAINTLSVDSQSIHVFGRWSGVANGTFNFENNNAKIHFIPNESFSSGEWVTVSISKHLTDQNGQNLEHGYAWNFWIKTAPTSMNVLETARINVRELGEKQIQSYGAYAGDLNGDGYSDFAVPNEISNDIRVFLNDGFGNYGDFNTYAIPNGSSPSPNEGADFNGDGIIDLAVGNTRNTILSVFMGDGTGGFLPVNTYEVENGVRGVCVLDVDGDSDVDIVTANRLANSVSIIKNEGNGVFAAAVHFEAGGDQETGCAVADANNDGIPDLFIGTLGGANYMGEIILLTGDGQGNFQFSSKIDVGGGSWMIAVGDIDGDKNVDVVSANSFQNNISVIRGDGTGSLLPAVIYPAIGEIPIAIDLGDLNGDGDLDIIVSNYHSANWTIYENAGDGTFINPKFLAASKAASCAIFHDRDNDGDMDITGIDEVDDLLFLFTNESATGIETESTLPKQFDLQQNFPNPFTTLRSSVLGDYENATTTISYKLAVAGNISLKIHNINGKLISNLIEQYQDAGNYRVSWNGYDFNGKLTPSGIYFYTLKVGEFMKTRRLIFMH